MKEKFVITIGENGAILSLLKGDKLIERSFATNAIDNQIINKLKSNPKIPYCILLDNNSQNFEKKVFPPVNSINASQLAKNHIDKEYSAKNINSYINYGKNKQEGGNWTYLFTSIVKPPAFDDWMEIFSELPNEFKGLHILACESQSLISDLISKTEELSSKGDTKKWQLLVTNNKVCGLRISAFEENRLVLSRTLPISSSSSDIIAGNVEQEINNTVEYIRRLGFSEDNILEACIIVSEDIKNVINLENSSIDQAQVSTPYDVAEKIGLSEVVQKGDRYSDILTAAHFLSKNSVALTITPDTFKEKKTFLLYKTASLIAFILIIAFLSFGIFKSGKSIISLNNQIDSLKNEKLLKKKEYDEFKEQQKYSEKFRSSVYSYLSLYEKFNYELPIQPLDIIGKIIDTDRNDKYISSLKIDNNPFGDVFRSGSFAQNSIQKTNITVVWKDLNHEEIEPLLDEIDSYVNYFSNALSPYIVKVNNYENDIFNQGNVLEQRISDITEIKLDFEISKK